MIAWPAVIKYEGDDELTYIDCENDWMRDARSYLYNHNGDNCLIDSNGEIFTLSTSGSGNIDLTTSGNRVSLDDFTRLVRTHASTVNRCCIEKISFRNIADGVKLIDSMNEPE
jgi:hypothetical protein